MVAHVTGDTRLDPVEKVAWENQVKRLRKEGKTFVEIGRLIAVSPRRARYLFLCAARRGGTMPRWTDGLNPRLATSLHWLGFRGREDVAEAFTSGHLQRLTRFERGLRGKAIAELAQWLGLDSELTEAVVQNASEVDRIQSVGQHGHPHDV